MLPTVVGKESYNPYINVEGGRLSSADAAPRANPKKVDAIIPDMGKAIKYDYSYVNYFYRSN